MTRSVPYVRHLRTDIKLRNVFDEPNMRIRTVAALSLLGVVLSACEVNTVSKVSDSELVPGETYILIKVSGDGKQISSTDSEEVRFSLERSSTNRCIRHDVLTIYKRDFPREKLLMFKVSPGYYTALNTLNSPSRPNEKVLSFSVEPGRVNVLGALRLTGDQLSYRGDTRFIFANGVSGSQVTPTFVEYPVSYKCTP